MKKNTIFAISCSSSQGPADKGDPSIDVDQWQFVVVATAPAQQLIVYHTQGHMTWNTNQLISDYLV